MAVINRGMFVKKKVSGLHRSLYCSVHCYSLDKNYYVRIYKPTSRSLPIFMSPNRNVRTHNWFQEISFV
ncbi:hypothetical protein WDU94_012132 [Cyamophila willieti]